MVDLDNSSVAEKKKTDIKLSSGDWGWVAVSIGMGLGAGIVFLPVQAGLVGLWVFLISIVVAYPALYLFQRLFLNTLAECPNCQDYSTILSEYLGEKWGVVLGGLYFLMLIIWVFVYSETITNDSASYLHYYGLTSSLLSDNPIYSLVLVAFMVLFAFKSRVILFHVSKVLVVVILLLLIILAILVIPYWSIDNIMPITSFWKMIKDAIITLPFAMTSILFLQSISPMVVAIRSESQSKEEARKRAIKIMNTAFILLATVVFFFALSCTLAIGHDEAVKAFKENTSFLAILVKHIPGVTIPLIGIVISIFAIMTSFFGALLGFHEACIGLATNVFLRRTPRELINMKQLSAFVVIFTIIVAWCAALLNFPILYFTSICSPIFGIVGCFIPVILVYKSESLRKYRGIVTYVVSATGILLVISPFFAFL